MDQEFREKVLTSLTKLETNQVHMLERFKQDQPKIDKIPEVKTKADNNRKILWLLLVIYIPLIITTVVRGAGK